MTQTAMNFLDLKGERGGLTRELPCGGVYLKREVHQHVTLSALPPLSKECFDTISSQSIAAAAAAATVHWTDGSFS